MKWGVRKDTGHEGEAAKNSKIAKLDNKFEKRAGKLNTKIDLHNYAAHHMNTHELHRINNKKEYAGKDLTANPALAAKYNHEIETTYLKHLQNAASLSKNASGTKKYAIEANSKGTGWRVTTVDAEHDDSGYNVPTKRGPKGHIETLGDADVSDSMEQSVDLVDFLAHHGVLGMKWGHRKESSDSSSSKNTTAKRVSSDHLDAEAHKVVIGAHGLKALSNEDLKKLNERMQLEQTYRNLNSQTPTRFETGHKRVKKILAVGKTLNDINAIATSPVGKAARAAYKTQTAGKTAYKVYKVTKSDE